MRTPSAPSARVSRSITSVCVSRSAKQQADALEVLRRLEILQEVRLPAHDELARLCRADRRGKAGFDESCRQRVELALHVAAPGLDLVPEIGERLAADAGVEEVAGLRQGAGRQARREVEEAVLDRSVLGHEHDEGARRVEADELDMLQARIGLRRDDDTGPA